MSSLEDLSSGRRVVLCIDERFDDIQGLGQNYPESIQKALASLGPLKRNELDLLFRQWEFRNLFSIGEVLVLMSESTLKHSLIWKRLFSEIELIKEEFSPAPDSRKIVDYFSTIPKTNYSGNYSASKFQTYLDCPRKFYFSYVDRVFPDVALEKDFDALTSGSMIHKIIEEFHHRKLVDSELHNLTKELMEEHITEAGLKLAADVFLQRELIFNHRAFNGISFLKHLSNILGQPVSWEIEVDFKLSLKYLLSGKIDCLGISKDYVFLLDFKSTKSAASTNKEVEEFESLQLWAYALAAKHRVPDFESKSLVLGYVVLDDASESNLLVSDENLFNLLKVSKTFRSKLFKAPLPELLRDAQTKMDSLQLAIAQDDTFAASPRKASACHFCELSSVCIKGELTHE